MIKKAEHKHHKEKKKIVKKKKKEILSAEEKKGRKNECVLLFSTEAIVPSSDEKLSSEMEQFLLNLRRKMPIAIVCRSNLTEQKEQLGPHVLNEWDYVFLENGLVAHKDGQHLATRTLVETLGEDKMKAFVNFCLRYIADLDIPMKRGTFLELRNGMINISPLGRNSSPKEREAFQEFEKKNRYSRRFCDRVAGEV